MEGLTFLGYLIMISRGGGDMGFPALHHIGILGERMHADDADARFLGEDGKRQKSRKKAGGAENGFQREGYGVILGGITRKPQLGLPAGSSKLG